MQLGKYLHYKGKYYWVIGVAKHSETLEDFERTFLKEFKGS